eukprot:6220550-Amphidinium_carterae.1
MNNCVLLPKQCSILMPPHAQVPSMCLEKLAYEPILLDRVAEHFSGTGEYQACNTETMSFILDQKKRTLPT